MGQTMPLPITAAMVTPANANAAKPRYVGSPADWAGGIKGDDVDQATAAVAIANSHSANVETDYSPRTQAAKATAMGTTLAVDVARARGWIAPGQPYTGTVPAAPVVSSLSPATAAATALPLTVTITGTGFTPWSTVHTGGQGTPDASGQYVSATTMKVALFAAAPGTVSVAVEDHGVLSNTTILFTVT